MILYPLLHDVEWLKAQVDAGMSDAIIGELAGGATWSTVRGARERYGIPARAHKTHPRFPATPEAAAAAADILASAHRPEFAALIRALRRYSRQ